VVTYTVDNAVEAEEKLKNLLSYLLQAHGKSATYWFNPTAIERADNMSWDKANDRPITVEEIDLDLLLDDDLDWVANMESADISFKSTVKVSLERPSLLHKVSNNPFNGEADSVQIFHPGVTNLPPPIWTGTTAQTAPLGLVMTLSLGTWKGLRRGRCNSNRGALCGSMTKSADDSGKYGTAPNAV
jgi:hypothetical protein